MLFGKDDAKLSLYRFRSGSYADSAAREKLHGSVGSMCAAINFRSAWGAGTFLDRPSGKATTSGRIMNAPVLAALQLAK